MSVPGWRMSQCLPFFVLAIAIASPLGVAAEPAAGGNAAGMHPSALRSAGADEEEAFDEKLREFGYWSGVALSCVPESRQLEVERQVLSMYQRIVQLFGTDRGFFYAAALGRGTSVTVDESSCPEFLKKFEKAAAVHRSLEQSR